MDDFPLNLVKRFLYNFNIRSSSIIIEITFFATNLQVLRSFPPTNNIIKYCEEGNIFVFIIKSHKKQKKSKKKVK